MRSPQLWKIAIAFLVCAFALGQPASAMETTKIEITIGDVHFMFHGVCVGRDPRTGLIRIVAQMELQPSAYAERWIAHYTVEGPDEDHAHAWAKLAGVGLFYGRQPGEMLRLMPMPSDYRLDVDLLNVWPGPVSQSQLLGALQGAINVFFFSETRGLYDAFVEMIGILQFPAPMCMQGTSDGQSPD